MIIDPLAVLMLGIVTFVALGIQVYSLEYMRGDPRYGWYFAVHALFAASMLSLVVADNLLLLYIAWELVGVVLIPSHRSLVRAPLRRRGG